MQYAVVSIKSVLPTSATRKITAVMLVSCLAVFASPALFAQSTASPQGGAAIYTQPAVCAASNSGFSGAQNFQPCTDSSGNGQWFTVMNASVKASTNKTLFVSPLFAGATEETAGSDRVS